MFLVYVSLATVTCLCLLKCALATNSAEELTTNKKTSEETDIQQMAPLIDIVFTNGEKRTCTGAIIHENAVITAGHCFTQSGLGESNLKPELTTSFVVIGTKKKFEAGYEQYLPIEKVLIHPKRKGLSADLALVITFASMSIDNVGGIMPLADENTYSSRRPNITIMSWGPIVRDKPKAKDEKLENDDIKSQDGFDESCGSDGCHSESNNDDNEKDNNNDDGTEYTTRFGEEQPYNHPTGGSTKQNASPNAKGSNSNIDEDSSERRHFSKSQSKQTMSLSLQGLIQAEPGQKIVKKNQKNLIKRSRKKTTKALSRYLTAYQGNANSTELFQRMHELQRGSGLRKKLKRYQNWRRQLGGQQVNKMTVENFRVVKPQACERILEDIGRRDEIIRNEIVCYTTDGRHITDADSGAPAVQNGQLLAITVGGVNSQGDHVAVGMNVSHFCPWIAENLPVSDTTISCWSGGENYDQNNRKNVANPSKYLINYPKKRPNPQWGTSAEYRLTL